LLKFASDHLTNNRPFCESKVAKYYADSKSFETAILGFLNNLDLPERKAEMDTRMTLNFQLFSNAGIVA
jgi:hypothetical protein